MILNIYLLLYILSEQDECAGALCHQVILFYSFEGKIMIISEILTCKLSNPFTVFKTYTFLQLTAKQIFMNPLNVNNENINDLNPI